MSKQRGILCLVKAEDDIIGGQLNASMSNTADKQEATTKDSTGNDKEYVQTFKDVTGTVDGLYDPSPGGSKKSFEDMWAYWNNLTQISIEYGGNESGETYYSFEAVIDSIDHNGNNQELQGWTINFTRTGSTTKGTRA